MEQLESLKKVVERFRRGPSDVVGIDVDVMGVKAVHMRKSNDGISLLAADVLPPLEIPDLSSEPDAQVPVLELPPKLKARYACLAIPGEESIVKLLSFPGQFDAAAEEKVVDNMGLDDPGKYRISYKVINEGHGKSEARVLTVAVPETLAQTGPMLLPIGLPAPFSLEIAGLAAITSFLHGPAAQHEEEAVGVVDFGDSMSSFALFNKNVLALIRRFGIGTNSILDKVQESLGVDRETAQGIIADGSFDISQSVGEVLEPLIKQLVVSRDFVERRENCHITKMYVSGGLIVSRDSLDEMKSSMGVDIDFWNPFDGLTVMPDAVPENLKGQEWRFPAAVGACLATFEET